MPSQIAASAVILAINIYEWDHEKKGKSKTDFFKNCPRHDNLVWLNLEVWNNNVVHKLTGKTVDHIRNCLMDLFHFIYNSLSPNRLENFDPISITKTKAYCDE
jgi:hypothetical protein